VLCMVPNRAAPDGETLVERVTLVRRRAWYTSAAWRLEQAGLAPLFVTAYGHRARAGRLLEALAGPPDVLAADLNLAGVLASRAAGLRVHTSHNTTTSAGSSHASRCRATGPAASAGSRPRRWGART